MSAYDIQNSGRQQLCTFHLGELYLGIEVSKVLEITRFQEMTRVPLAPRYLRGLINLRGQIVCAIDLRRRMFLEDGDGDMPPINAVLQTDDGAISLLVDNVGDVVHVDESSFEPPPPTLDPSVKAFIAGVHKLEGRLLLVLDTEELLRAPHETLAS